MKSILVNPDQSIEVVDIPIPKPESGEVLIKVVTAGANPKDWKYPHWLNKSSNTGDDVAGIVEEVGEGVYEFKKGDRVVGFHHYLNQFGTYAEYTITPEHLTAKIPDHVSFEEAATIPLAAFTAVTALYEVHRLPNPWTPAIKPTPLLVYGAATAVGAFAIKLARLSNIHPIIGVVGRGKDFAEGLIDRSKGDDLVDYREGDEAVVNGIKAALQRNGFEKADHIVDCVSEHGSVVNAAAFLGKTGVISGVLPLSMDPKAADLPKDLNWKMTYVSWVHEKEWPEESEERKQAVTNAGRELGFLFLRYFAKGLNEGWFKGHPYEVIEGGLNGVGKGLKDLKDGKASAVKYVFRVEDTK